VKLTPNVADIRTVARAAKQGGADALSAINTINSITGVDLDTFIPRPNVDGASSHGGYCGPAIKPIALHMAQQISADPGSSLPLSGIGGVATWSDAAEFILLGSGTVQVCTAAMHYGFRVVEDLIDGLSNWMDEKSFQTIDDFRGLSCVRVREWKDLNLNYKIVAAIDPAKCIGCELCYVACWDGAHQCIHLDREEAGLHPAPPVVEAASRARIAVSPVTKAEQANVPYGRTPLARIPRIDESECVGCNLCMLVCPVDECITMKRVDTGVAAETWAQRSATATGVTA
jgi:dihydropyrimidine dehydrogenase (NAD+) subunit PreA